MEKDFRTTLQRRREARNQAIYAEYIQLSANPTNSKMEVNKHLMEKYSIYAISTLYAIIHREERKMKQSKKQK